MRVRETSIDAYNEIKANGLLSEKRFQVYEILVDHGPLTGAEVSQRIRQKHGRSTVSETVRNRLTELRDLGVVREVGQKPCPITGRTVIVWDVTKNLPEQTKKPDRTTCPHCKGLGYFEQGRLL